MRNGTALWHPTPRPTEPPGPVAAANPTPANGSGNGSAPVSPDFGRRLEAACLPIMEEWLTDIDQLNLSQLKAVPVDDLRMWAFMLVRRVIEFVGKELGADLAGEGGREDFKQLFFKAASWVVDAIDDQVPYTAGRSERVKIFAGRIASMAGLSDEEIADIEYAARIHNLGLINSSQRIFRMPRRLSPDELSMARNHSQVGADIMRPIDFLSSIGPMVRYHHASWDGRGFPAGVGGEDIPVGSRVIHLADAFEAMISERPHRAAKTRDEALNEIRNLAGVQFDPELTKLVDVLR